jgi:hypothetical protein
MVLVPVLVWAKKSALVTRMEGNNSLLLMVGKPVKRVEQVGGKS